MSSRAVASGTKATPKLSGEVSGSWRSRAGQMYSGEEATPPTTNSCQPLTPRISKVLPGRELEVVGHVLFDEEGARLASREVAAGGDPDLIDGRLRFGRQSDDPAEELEAIDSQRDVGDGAEFNRFDSLPVAGTIGETLHVAARHRQVGKPEVGERALVGRRQVLIGVVRSGEHGDAQEDGDRDGNELGSLGADVAQQFVSERAHQISSPASMGAGL